jgi:O6-methylguanine-DNA--protein-cysteine methyltransferase
MQFYIIHDDPAVSSRALPDYGIKTNVREGYQMLSDMGRLFDITWDGQFNEYNPYHAETRQYWKNIESFDFFISHYERCLAQYELRFWRQTKWHEGYFNFQKRAYNLLREAIMGRSEKYNQVIQYLLVTKSRKLKPKEISVLQSMS